MSLYSAANFNKNESLNFRINRLRHVHLIFAKNLSIIPVRFNVWFTLHQSRHTRAFYISEKKENDRNPKWHPLNASKISYKEFCLRIWYSNLDATSSSSNKENNSDENFLHKDEIHDAKSVAESKPGLNLLLEMNVCLNSLEPPNESSHLYSTSQNLVVFEIFGKNYCEPLLSNSKKSSLASHPSSISNQSGVPPATGQSKPPTTTVTKPSYSVNLMTRLHDFQRVMHETSLKIAQLKHTSTLKFGASAKLRDLQMRKDDLQQKIGLYKQQLRSAQLSTNHLSEVNAKICVKSKAFSDKLNARCEAFEKEKQHHSLEQIENRLNARAMLLMNEQIKLKKRQHQMVNELAGIFPIQKLTTTSDSHYTRNRMKILNVNFRSYNSGNLTVKNVEHQNAVVLGYIIHSLSLLSDIMSLPLRHPVIFRGSKSYMIEQLNPENSCEYPLFRHNSSTQDPSFAHAVVLLNKNLSQFRLTFDSHKNVDANDMLGNLKWLFDHL